MVGHNGSEVEFTHFYFKEKIMKYFILTTILIFAMVVYGCEKSSNYQKIKEEVKEKIKYPDNKPGNYVILSDSIIKEFNLTEEKIESFQYYISQKMEIELNFNELRKNTNKDANVIKRDTELVHIKTIHIKKYTPAIIIKNKIDWIKTANGWVSNDIGYLVDVGDGVLLTYNVFFKAFNSVKKYNNKIIDVNSSSFIRNAELIFDLSHPIIKPQIEDSITVTGKRK